MTSSSDNKLASIKKLSSLINSINYKTHPHITKKARKLTRGKGVNLIVNTIGTASIPSHVDTLAEKGIISLVGFLGGDLARD